MEKRMRIKIVDEIEFCCKKMRKYYESHENIRFDSINHKMSYGRNYIDVCPFCGMDIEIDVSKSHWGGERKKSK